VLQAYSTTSQPVQAWVKRGFSLAKSANDGTMGSNGGYRMTTMNISVPDEMKAFVEAQMAQEGYASASEYLRALIRDAQKRQAKQELEAKLLEGLQSPVSEMTDADWSALRQRIFDKNPELASQG
jgi:antitoxin ParD1/3/4